MLLSRRPCLCLLAPDDNVDPSFFSSHFFHSPQFPSEDAEPAVEVAPSWVEKLSLEPRDYETRCPHGFRRLQMESSVHEIYAEYLREDGLVRK